MMKRREQDARKIVIKDMQIKEKITYCKCSYESAVAT